MYPSIYMPLEVKLEVLRFANVRSLHSQNYILCIAQCTCRCTLYNNKHCTLLTIHCTLNLTYIFIFSFLIALNMI